MTQKYIHLRNMVFNQPHLCTPDYAETVLAVLSDKLGLEEGAFQIKNEAKDQREDAVDQNGVYTLPIIGSMVHRGGMLDSMSGTMSYEGIQAKIQSALDNPQVTSILLDVDSSGGAVAGAFDLRDFILQAKEQKPIYAIARDTMASAAYLISSAATKVYATQTAGVGSIGVVAMHVDQSAKNEREGLKPTFIYAGNYKVAGNGNGPLEGEALSYLQESVNDSYDMFVGAVAEARGIDEKVIRDTEARVYKGRKAAALGLVDGVRSLKAVYKELANAGKSSTKGLRMENNLDVEKLQADLNQAATDYKKVAEQLASLETAVKAEGYEITEQGLSKVTAPEMIEVAGVLTEKASIPEHVLKMLESTLAEKADIELTAKASHELPNFAIDVAKALVGQFGDNEEVMKALKGADKNLGELFEEIGKRDEVGDLMTAKEKFDALVKAHMAENAVDVHKARAVVAQTETGKALQKEILKG